MNLEDIQFLVSNEGQKALVKASMLAKKADNLALKLNNEGVEHAAALVTILALRAKASGKFEKADKMLFTPLSLEQSTSERIARYIAGRFGEGRLIADLTCGCGGNAIFLAEKNEVLASDINMIVLEVARHNARIYGVDGRIKFSSKSAENFADKVDAFFIDPARDLANGIKTRGLVNARPNITELLPKLMLISENIGIKISPAFDYEEIRLLPGDPEVELISEDGVVKVAMLWFGALRHQARQATCFRGDELFILSSVEQIAEQPLVPVKYLVEPDNAIIKARLIDQFASRFALAKLDPQVAYLVSEVLPCVPRVAGRVWEISERAEFSLKNLQSSLKAQGIDRADITSRAFPIEHNELYKKLKIKEGGEWQLIFATIKRQKYYFLGKRVN